MIQKYNKNRVESLINAFVAYYNKIERCNYHKYSRPDKLNSSSKDIDYIYADNNTKAKLAIEHTSIDEYRNIRTSDPLLEKLEKELPKEILNLTGYRFFGPEPGFDFKGQNSKSLAQLISNWILKNYNQLPEPKSNRISRIREKIDGAPFEFELHRSAPEIKNKFSIQYRNFLTEVDGAYEEIMLKALNMKMPKLLKYSRMHKTVLIIEFWDIISGTVCAQWYNVFHSVKRRFNQFPDYIYFIWSAVPTWWCFSVKNKDVFNNWNEYKKYVELKTFHN